MPAACDQTFEHCLIGDGRIQVKWLRIKLAREVDNFLFAKTAISATWFESVFTRKTGG